MLTVHTRAACSQKADATAMNAARVAAENAGKEASVKPNLVQKELLYAELAHAAKVTHDHMSAKKRLTPSEQKAAELERQKQKVYEAKEEDMRAKLNAAFAHAKAVRMAAERKAAARPGVFTAAFTSSLFAACALVFGLYIGLASPMLAAAEEVPLQPVDVASA